MDSLQPGDACVECSSRGLNHKLRYFYINLEEQLLKCESRSCLWPHTDAVSSDEEEVAIEPPIDLNMDDDDFIMQLLGQLTPDITNEASLENNEKKSSLTPNVPANTEDIFSGHWDSAQQLPPSPKQTKEVEQFQETATTDTTALSMPNLLSKSEQTEQTSSDFKSVIPPPFEVSVKAGEIAYTISVPQALNTPPIPTKKDLPKANPFHSPPKKASTLARSQLPRSPLPQNPQVLPKISATASQFLNALKTQPVQSGRSKRNTQRARSETGNIGGSARLTTQDIKQTLERISRLKESRAESEPEPEQEREGICHANAEQKQ